MAWTSDLARGTGLRPAQYFEALVKAHFPGGPTSPVQKNFRLQQALKGDKWPLVIVGRAGNE